MWVKRAQLVVVKYHANDPEFSVVAPQGPFFFANTLNARVERLTEKDRSLSCEKGPSPGLRLQNQGHKPKSWGGLRNYPGATPKITVVFMYQSVQCGATKQCYFPEGGQIEQFVFLLVLRRLLSTFKPCKGTFQ